MTLLDRLLPPVPATRPAVHRALLGTYTAVYLGKRVRMLGKIHRTSPDLFDPVGPVRVLQRPLPPRAADALVGAELAANALFTLGAWHRVTGPVHAATLLWTLSYRNSWSMIFHSDNTMVLHSAVLGLTPAADALSVDALVRHGRAGLLDGQRDWRFGWPGTVCSAVTAAAYLLAGVAKVKSPLGWAWATGESLRSQVAADGLRKELLGSSAAPLGVRLYRQTTLWRLMAVGSLALELVAPLALLDHRSARGWAVSAFGMHWGIRAVMGIRFRYQMSGVAYASYVPLERVLDPATWRAVWRAVRR